MRAWGIVLLACALAGCAGQPALPRSATLPAQARTQPSNYLVVTLRNRVVPAPLLAASTPRGYGGLGHYQASGSALSQSKALARQYRLLEVASWPIAALGVHCLVYALPAGSEREPLVARLARDPRVESVQALQAFDTASSPYNDPYAALQLNVAQMAVPEAHAVSRGARVRIAIIDTGADTGHPDFGPGAAIGRNFVNTDAAEFRSDPHGTAVAGIIGAVPNNAVGIVGVAPEVQLLVFKACWRSAAEPGVSVCNTFTLAQALAAAIDAHVDIINLSLGGPNDPLLSRLVNSSLGAGTIVVGAMPRDGLRHGFPVEIAGVLAVDVAESDRSTPGVIRAPGREILSLAPEGHYDFYSGSSLAAAEVSGLVALLKSERPHLTAREAEALLTDSAVGRHSGANACAALTALLHRSACPAVPMVPARLGKESGI